MFLDLASQSSLSLHSSGADDDDTSLIRDPITHVLQSLCDELVVGQLMLYDDLNTLRTFKLKSKGNLKLKESFNAGGEDGSYSIAHLNPKNIESAYSVLNQVYTLFQSYHSKLTKSQTKVNGPKLQVIEYTKPYNPGADGYGTLYYLSIILFTSKRIANQRSLGEIEPQGDLKQLEEFSSLRKQIHTVKELAHHLDKAILGVIGLQ